MRNSGEEEMCHQSQSMKVTNALYGQNVSLSWEKIKELQSFSSC